MKNYPRGARVALSTHLTASVENVYNVLENGGRSCGFSANLIGSSIGECRSRQ